ncbi:E3 ubiquitin-protein ligase UBR1-like [Actinia tenebrosa]|uniref:E3 ubiquitin-protein ligase n=1 Tax=Actinia tenebrosa TaxID=6105 RepID=A0A6P8ISU1_ACTTE|nr:E3 ubiquitin-protein ligase UBR1-like [Actinia tenebrosa]
MSDEEMEVVPFMAADSREACLAKEWLRTVNQATTNDPDVFKKLFFQLLSDKVFPCFEVTNAQTLKVNVKEELCQETILNVLEYFLLGEEPSTGLEKLQSLNKPPQLCGKMFKYGDPTFSCRDCGYDGTCVLCIDCFQKSIHKDHQYKVSETNLYILIIPY